jgi:hypothetical protein
MSTRIAPTPYTASILAISFRSFRRIDRENEYLFGKNGPDYGKHGNEVDISGEDDGCHISLGIVGLSVQIRQKGSFSKLLSTSIAVQRKSMNSHS